MFGRAGTIAASGHRGRTHEQAAMYGFDANPFAGPGPINRAKEGARSPFRANPRGRSCSWPPLGRPPALSSPLLLPAVEKPEDQRQQSNEHKSTINTSKFNNGSLCAPRYGDSFLPIGRKLPRSLLASV